MKTKTLLALQPHEASPPQTRVVLGAIPFCVALVLLMGLAFPLACGTLITSSTMNESLTINGSTCFTVTAANVTLDCNGFSVTGNNSTGTYGIYSNQFNTTVRNCNISNFGTGIYFSGADNGTIENTNASTTAAYSVPSGMGIYLYNGANYNTIRNSNAYSAIGRAVYVYLSSDRTTVANMTASSITGQGLYVSGSDNSTFTNVTASSDTVFATYIRGCINTTLSNSRITGYSTSYGALLVADSAQYCTFSGNVINGLAGTRAMSIRDGNNTGNLLINNTILNATDLLYLDANASANTICLNNFTDTTGYYVQDLNGSNYYNCTYGSNNEGNVYHNVMNGSVVIYGTTTSSIAGLFIGTNINYTNTTSLGKFSCNFANCADYAPLTTIGSAPYPSGFSFTLPASWLTTYYAPNSQIPINWTISTSPLNRTINYTLYLYLYNGTLNGTLASTNETNYTFNSTGYNELRYYIRASACDDGLSLCTYNNSNTFGIYAPSLSANYSPYASNDGAIVPHNYFTEYCSFSCFPDYVCNLAGANLSLIGGAPYRNITTTNYTGTNVGLNFTNLNSSNYKRLCEIYNIYNESSISSTREVTINGEPVQPITNIPQQVPQYLFLAFIWLLAGWLIYNSFKKTSANSKKENGGSDNHV